MERTGKDLDLQVDLRSYVPSTSCSGRDWKMRTRRLEAETSFLQRVTGLSLRDTGRTSGAQVRAALLLHTERWEGCGHRLTGRRSQGSPRTRWRETTSPGWAEQIGAAGKRKVWVSLLSLRLDSRQAREDAWMKGILIMFNEFCLGCTNLWAVYMVLLRYDITVF